MATPFHVIIIGAGTGGATLAHGLKQAGISVAVYERHRTRTDGLYGYRVGIDPDGSRALKQCLPPDLFETFFATCARDPKYFNIFSEKFKECLSVPLRQEADQINREKSVSRMTLRQVLLTDLDDVVHYDKSFKLYEQNADGTVTAYFEDGTSATGDLLIAADGSRSKVRQQYLPQMEVKHAKVISIAAKVEVNAESRAMLPEQVWNGITIIMAPKGHTGLIHVMEFPWGQDGEVKHEVAKADADLIKNWPGLLYDNTRDYINWSWWASSDKYPANLTQLSGEELIELSIKMNPKWHPDLHKLMRMSDPSTCFTVDIYTSEPIPQWDTTNITLLGDAIHTMTPGRGVGANTALRDAALITRNLIKARDGKMSVHDAIRDYETKMIKYGFDAVLKSRKQTSGDDPMHKPVIGRIILAVTRTFARIVNHVPAFKRKMSNSLYTYRGGDREED